ncbi:MAG: alpha/beta fold hydrolase [Jatrophihabitantaceae bacterium]
MIDLDRIVPLHPEGCAPPLFCVHAASGSAYSYLKLAQLLGANRPVYGLEAPGFDGDREPVRSLRALSAEYVETLLAFRPEADFLLLGWSFGGSIAFDMAQRLTAAGASVGKVVMVDASTPWVAELPPEREIVRRFLHDLLATVGAPTAAVTAMLNARPAQADSETLFAAAEQAGVLPDDLDVDLLTERYPVFRAHLEALFGFEVTNAYHGPVVHLIASESPLRYMRWGNVATNLTEHIVPGSHHSIWTDDGLNRLAYLVSDALAEADCADGHRPCPQPELGAG